MRAGPPTLLLVSLLLAGCVACEPEPAAASASVVDAVVRTLPMLGSGATSLAGVDVRDAHGRVALRVETPPAGVRVAPGDVGVVLRVADGDVPARVVRVEIGDEAPGQISPTTALHDGSSLTVWWTVDRRGTPIADALLPEHAPFALRVDVPWTHESCDVETAGEFSTLATGTVRASAEAEAFAARGTPTLELTPEGVGFATSFALADESAVQVRSVEARAVLHAADAEGPAHVVLFPGVGWTVGGRAVAEVRTGDVLHVQSTEQGGAGAAYATSGTVAPPAEELPPGLWVLVVEIVSTPEGSDVPRRDLVAHGILRARG